MWGCFLFAFLFVFFFFELEVLALVERSDIWVSMAMELVRGRDCTVYREWMSSPKGSIWSEKEAEGRTPCVMSLTEQGKSVQETKRGRELGQKGKEQSSSDSSKAEWPVVSNIAGLK